MKKLPPKIRENTPEEDAAIRKAIASDPDTWTLTPEMFKAQKNRRKPFTYRND